MTTELPTPMQLAESSMPPTPSFEPWLGRVRAVRAAVAGAGMLLGTASAWTGGMEWVDAVLRGMAASVVLYFLGWAAALWVCSELYGGQVKHVREAWAKREADRQRHIQELYVKRMHLLADTGMVDAASIEEFATATMPLQPPPAAPQPDLADTQPLRRAA